MGSQKYAVVDLETTGHSQATGDRIIQIAIVIMKDWRIEKTFTTFIHPGKSIPLFIQDLTHITDSDVQEALPFEAHAETIYELIQDAIFVAHNADFDLSFLQAEFVRAGLPKWYGKKIDTVELCKILFPTSLSYKLGDLAHDFNIPLVSAHRADDDAKATALLLKRCWEELLTLPLSTIEQLHKKSFRLKSNISQLLFEALQLKRSNVQDEDGYVYYRKIALKKIEKNERLRDQVMEYPKSSEEKIELFHQQLAHFEERPGQFQMMDVIWDRLNSKQEVVIEASTGIGKTIGYLLPSIVYSIKHNRKICISTYTSHLLEQLLNDEIPKVSEVLNCQLKVALLKGMHHYVDVVSFEQMMRIQDVSYDDTMTILQVLVWLAKTKTGDLNELNVSGGGQLFIDKIRKDVNGNPLQNEFDFYERAIEESKEANLIITNHSMLLADLVRKTPVFNEIDGWIIDEAHQFIQAAVAKDEYVFSFTYWKYIFGQLGLSSDTQLFSKFQKAALKKYRLPIQMLDQLEKKFIQIIEQFNVCMNAIVKQLNRQTKRTKYDPKVTAFLNDLQLDKTLFQQLSNKMQSWIDLAEQSAAMFRQDVEEMAPEHFILLEQWEYWIREYKVKVSEWDEIFLQNANDTTIWVEMDGRNIPGSLQIFKKPTNVTRTIQQLTNLMKEYRAIIWTSGTLTVPHNERYIANQLGIAQDIPIVKLQAPPSYYKGAQAFIVTDMPDIQTVSQSEYIESCALAITSIVRTTKGRCFVLFTSKDMLKKTVELIQESQLLEDYMLFAQGVTTGSRMRLLKSFQKFSHSVLFGTNSFWEGVDVPGDGLSTVIVVRLPFSSPEDPSFKVKSNALTNEGKNAFTELSLPEAIIRFKQGFGRLIRSSQDKGAFIILDRRIETKSYGTEFLHSLPQITIQKLPLEHMVNQLEHWYNDKDDERKQVE